MSAKAGRIVDDRLDACYANERLTVVYLANEKMKKMKNEKTKNENRQNLPDV